MPSKLAAGAVRVAPARPSPGWLTALLVKIGGLAETYRQRRALLALNDHMLRDLGLSRADAHHEGTRPFWDLPRR